MGRAEVNLNASVKERNEGKNLGLESYSTDRNYNDVEENN